MMIPALVSTSFLFGLVLATWLVNDNWRETLIAKNAAVWRINKKTGKKQFVILSNQNNEIIRGFSLRIDDLKNKDLDQKIIVSNLINHALWTKNNYSNELE